MNKKLKRLYDGLNLEYWGGNLPPIEIQSSKNLHEYMGLFVWPKSEKFDDLEAYKIILCSSLTTKEEQRATMLHEMCHLSVFLENKEKYWKRRLSWHGLQWKAEMIRVGFKPPITPYT